MSNSIRLPSDDLTELMGSWGGRARADASDNQTPPADTPETLARAFRDAMAQVRRLRDAEQFMAKLNELGARIDALDCRERARQALLEAEAIFTSPDDPNATRH
jgi:hypothetical protein